MHTFMLMKSYVDGLATCDQAADLSPFLAPLIKYQPIPTPFLSIILRHPQPAKA